MSEEPRRSGRAGKGINPKHAEVSPPPAPPAKKAAKGKSKKSQEPEEEEDDDAIIRCVCGIQDDEGGRVMVCCEKCEAWQHNTCMGVTEIEADLPEEYYCEQCKPQNHKALVAAMKKGEKPWEEITQKVPEGKGKKGKKSKGGRQSVAPKEETPVKEGTKTPTSVAPEVVPGVQERGKRKQSSEMDGNEQPTKLRKPSVQDKTSAEDAQSSRKAATPAVLQKKVTKRAPPQQDEIANTVEDLPSDGRKPCASFLKTKFEAQIKTLSSNGRYRIPDGHTPSSLAEVTALAVENAMFKAHIEPKKPDFKGPYTTQMRAIGANVFSNNELILRLVNQEITPDQLAKMSSDDMASEERQREAALIKEQADKQATLVQEETGRPHVRRTHKGEEYIEDPNQGLATSESLPPAPPPPRRESEFIPPQSPTVNQDVTMTDDNGPPGSLDRRSSSNFDIKNVWQSVQSPDKTHSSTFPPPSAQRHEHSIEPKQEQDATIDRLLEDDENESAPYSPGDYEAPVVAWKGDVDMPNIGRFKAIAQHVAGADLSSRGPVAAIFPESFTMSGRIHGQKADDYLSSLGSARSTDVVAFNIVPQESGGHQFQKLWKYFVDRDRWGVVSDQMHREHVTDTYIVPLKGGLGSNPTFLDRLDHNIIESPRPSDMLLAVFVIKWRNQALSSSAGPNDSAMTPSGHSLPPPLSATGPPGPGANLMSPIATPASAQSGIGFPPPHQPHNQLPHHGQGPPAFPGNPYDAPPQQNGHSLAQAILGEFIHCSTAQTILAADAVVPEPLLVNLRGIFEKHPLARTDIAEFQRILAMQGQEAS